MSFTPGPWFTTGTMTKYVEAKIGGGLVQEIASAGPTTDDNGYGAQQEANSRLIAAAPELLEALEALFDDYKQLADSGDCGCWLLEDQEVGKKALAVIAKARGEGVLDE